MLYVVSSERSIIIVQPKTDAFCIITIGPVSYTHLDVYKRQIYKNPLFLMKQGISAVIYKQKFKVMSQGRIHKKL